MSPEAEPGFGLPPQVRGAPAIGRSGSGHTGLTPAGAGSTEHGHHPPHRHWGLPPQVRGAQIPLASRWALRGLTPAGAGSTGLGDSAVAGVVAYPRRCGEHRLVEIDQEELAGLPPQVRGARRCVVGDRSWRGLTPAGAGST